MSVPTRKIGDKEFPAIGFGLMGISVAYGTVNMSDEERLKVSVATPIYFHSSLKLSQVLDRAFELGCTHWDTYVMINRMFPASFPIFLFL